MDFRTFLKKIPKVDIHLHVVGALRTGTLRSLAGRYSVALLREQSRLYDFSDFYDFLDILRLSAAVLREREDFTRLAYEALEDGHRAGNLRHAEFLFNPQYFYPSGISYREIVDGLLDGIRAAAHDFGTSCLLVPSIDRQISPAAAMEILDHILAYRPDEVVGIGLDGPERSGPPELFHDVYRRAGAAGLKRTAHVCEDNQTLEEAPPRHYATCCDVLGCDRLDHGYNLLADPSMIARARGDGLFFNTCSITSVTRNLQRRLTSIGKMIDHGLRVTINTDDPQMFKTDIDHCYAVLFEANSWDIERARAFSLDGVEASWLGDDQKRAMRHSFETEIAALSSQIEAGPGS